MSLGDPSTLADDWCCVAFKSSYDAAGDRDFAIVVDQFLEGHAFILQHRAVELDDPGPKDHPRPISIVSEIHIHFCPWCGRALQEFYRARLDEMVRPGLTIHQP